MQLILGILGIFGIVGILPLPHAKIPSILGTTMLLDPNTVPWDLAILTLLTGSFCVLLTAALTLRRKRKRKEAGGRLMLHVTGILAFIVFDTVLYGSVIEPRLIVVTERSVPFPTKQPLTIAVISDFHLGPYKGAAFLSRVVDRVNALHPDLVILAGDYVFDADSSLQELFPLTALTPPLGTFAVLGNYDTGRMNGKNRADDIVRALKEHGVAVLQDTSAIVCTDAFCTTRERFAVAALRDLQTDHPDLSAALRGIPPDMPAILLSHNPDIILDPRSLRAKLIISGHTHGGQVRLPILGPVPPLPTRLGRKFDQGIYTLTGGTVLAITRGVGETAARVRFFAPPEILLLKTTP